MMNFLRRLFRFIFGIKEKQCPRDIALSSASLVYFNGVTGQTGKSPLEVVASFMDDGSPAKGKAVRFEVLKGSIRLNGESDSVTLMTNDRGLANVDFTFEQQGHVVVMAFLVEDENKTVTFEGRSEGVTEQIQIFSEPAYPANPGKVEARIFLTDFLGVPVENSQLEFSGTRSTSQLIQGSAEEVGKGWYKGSFLTNLAGDWDISVADTISTANNSRCTRILPGQPKEIRFIDSIDPRSSAPYDTLLLRVRLEDEFGNATDPSSIQVTKKGGGHIEQFAVSHSEAQFKIVEIGCTEAIFIVEDSVSKISKAITIAWSGVWMEDPGLVIQGDSFITGVYGTPTIGKQADHATIEITFNPELVSFDGFKQTDLIPPVMSEVSVEDNKVIISLNSESTYTAEEYPGGIYIGDCTWTCQGEGDTCFDLVGKMSPSTPNWELCVTQKRRLDSCMCVNIIYKPGDTASRDKGRAAAAQIASVLSSTANVARCCPVLRIELHDHPITAAEWRRVRRAIGTHVSSQSEMDALLATQVGQRDDCFNMMLIEMNWGSFDGWTYFGTPSGGAGGGFGVFKPSRIDTVANGFAHEVGHAFNLRHSGAGGDTNNLMTDPQPHGDQLTAAQCRTIFENLSDFAC